MQEDNRITIVPSVLPLPAPCNQPAHPRTFEFTWSTLHQAKGSQPPFEPAPSDPAGTPRVPHPPKQTHPSTMPCSLHHGHWPCSLQLLQHGLQLGVVLHALQGLLNLVGVNTVGNVRQRTTGGTAGIKIMTVMKSRTDHCGRAYVHCSLYTGGGACMMRPMRAILKVLLPITRNVV